ncbi:pyridoxine-pyridoxal-pyridoxamine kinase [Schizosaccharomyces japonicus yFS275]|uniref:pyridoxal kinase n=1 Tax=Schizosaccharomyces japonicus (strain yFS275 / FY16936) TaxID=402676 RepID=B6JXS2_SCHJY|nr:pyridoxine-pyridoxal-pyridoxamine kinase [Schizosaccharomyces japonicus yFS275]EEB06340.1 pyridoxine-pyridoxal-pyridoxamine kinase [Schizosaccharomyces japonicus yFS275]
MTTKRLLCIQSSVCHGYVGSRSATFPLQLLGWDVDVIPTVELSTHAGYPVVYGRKVEPDQIADLYTGIAKANPSGFDCLLTGYARGKLGVQVIFDTAKQVKQSKPDTFWVLDPVMGDNGKLYVEQDVIPIYKEMLPYADLITPNAFEAEILADVKITSLDSAAQCAKTLHRLYKMKFVVITSFTTSDSEKEGSLYTLCSYSENDQHFEAYSFKVPIIKGLFRGTGDLLTALLASYMGDPKRENHEGLFLATSTAKALSSVHAVIRYTAERMKALGLKGVHPSETELCLIQCQNELKNPPHTFKPIPYHLE